MNMILLLAALTAQSAGGGDATVVQCALKSTPRVDVAAIQGGMLAGVVSGAKPTADLERRLKALRERATVCNPGSDTSDARAAEIVVASVATETLSNALQQRGSNVLAINAKLRKTPPTTLDAILAQRRDAQTDAFAKDVMAAAGGKDDAARSRLIGAYVFNAVRLAKLFAARGR